MVEKVGDDPQSSSCVLHQIKTLLEVPDIKVHKHDNDLHVAGYEQTN